ncbi:hypothetical protein [Thermomonospora cellulosilytica]|uniref:Uncharacterized protein n=1 Tax=Thermomonospora cellulosilytica TaxID=1411118 RepID=A0A7W3R7W7_9ACTN|nr:hypothetical protein [Thermomonospora cellulosilytica]MBA9003643.1 hypothetical protein [Thermomonospora cellulosilytica]
MTSPRPVTPIAVDAYTVDRAPDGALCRALPHEDPVPADVVCDRLGHPVCRTCWEPVGRLLERRGHRVIYTPAALAVWDRPVTG